MRDNWTKSILNENLNVPVVESVQGLTSLNDGDIVVINTDGIINILYRKSSNHNAIFVTEKCNNYCLMCSQPPKKKDDIDYLYKINMKLIEIIPQDVEFLGITGGEPTLLGKKLITLLEKIKTFLKGVRLDILTNARALSDIVFVDKIVNVGINNLSFCVPLFSDYYLLHDYISQSKNAFSQTITGLYNLARYQQKVEIRVILQKLTIDRLAKIANYIYRNLPFVNHVAFMGLEYRGHARSNKNILNFDLKDFIHQIDEAVNMLSISGINTSIYNIPNCYLPENLWKFCRKSISDWKNIYISECQKCRLRQDCCGLFDSHLIDHLKDIKSIA